MGAQFGAVVHMQKKIDVVLNEMCRIAATGCLKTTSLSEVYDALSKLS